MTMQKFNKAEGKLEVLTGRASNVLNDHFRRTGKFSVSDFSDDEREAFEKDLQVAEREDQAEAEELQEKKEAKEERKAAKESAEKSE